MTRERPCPVCQARCKVRESKAHKAYLICNAELEARACGARVVFGPRDSRELLAEAPASSSAPTPAPDRSPARKRRPAPPAASSRSPAAPPPAAPPSSSSNDGFALDDW